MKKALTLFLIFTVYNANAQTKKSQIKILKSQLDSFRNALKLLNYQYDSLLENKKAVTIHFGEQLSSLKTQLATTGKEKDSLSSTNLKLQSEVSSVDLRIKVFQDKITSLRDSLTEIAFDDLIHKTYYKWLLTDAGYGNKINISNKVNFNNPYSKEFSELSNLLSYYPIQHFDEPKVKQLGNIICISLEARHFETGIPYYGYGGHDFNQEVKLFLYKTEDTVLLSSIEDCFNVIKDQLLNEINKIAKAQFEEDLKLAAPYDDWSNKIKLPLYFKDLDFVVNDDDVCFIYDNDTQSPASGPRNRVCFTNEYILKYIK